jgi:hypothetical protein
VSHPNTALWIALGVGVVCIWCLITLGTWPPYKDGTWELSGEPAWWQFRVFLIGGLALSVVPSLVVYQLDSFFHTHESLRWPFVGLLVSIEVVLLCFAVYFIARSLASARSTTETRPNKSLERTRER